MELNLGFARDLERVNSNGKKNEISNAKRKDQKL